MYKCSLGSNLISVTVFEIYRVKILTVDFLVELTPGPKVTKRGDDLADSEIYHPAKFHRSTPTHARDIRYQNPADRQTDKQTKKYSKRYIPSMPIGMWG